MANIHAEIMSKLYDVSDLIIDNFYSLEYEQLYEINRNLKALDENIDELWKERYSDEMCDLTCGGQKRWSD